MSARPGRLGVGVVGAGRVGAVLGSALRAVGHAVVGVSAISQASLERAETLLPGVPVLEVADVVERAELVLLAVPDDALADLVAGLAGTGAWQPGQLVVHTSGRYGVEVLAPARAQGAIPLAIHPAMTFTGTSLDLARLEGTTFAVTSPAPVQPIGQALVVELGGEPVVVAEEARGLYHAALAHGANHLVVLVAQAAQALAAAGVAQPGRALSPLLAAALDGAVRAADAASPGLGAFADPTGAVPGARAPGGGAPGDGVPGDDVPEPSGPGAIAALTGPVSRGDVGTVVEHLRAFEDLAARAGATDLPSSYRELSRDAARRALAVGRITDHQAEQLLDVLEEGQ
ncbi:putative short-subunit dehydrogenase-like oxidoreductase (DUF2520 family) [Sediminihabitans luteus]|uniref:Putative short-subunit dehydrogenase-like oxidoreductase (DUF2520 family) n=1 Tax=Sediminihabitans luteus TaxID=1138585 RepID=A0A2M9CE72_9CELL|nr:DUF2520 domain-containing protein [Sediminihabitans luteus]PJJ70236.1 putative short-subunit dehydrogenase-like oxidoreductase (DUF2520 family) [Sediminihabitans luteus]GII97707.1 hypothetical protein Slu03_00850 [Sediminihabitans luteus]